MSTSLGRGRGARVKLDSKVGRAAPNKAAAPTRKTNPGMPSTPPIAAPSQVAFPTCHGSDVSLPISVIKALKTGCVTIEQLLQLSSVLIFNGSALELTHAEIIGELFRSLRSYVHSPHIPADSVRATRLAILRLLEIRQQGWTTAPSAEVYYKQNVTQLAVNSEVASPQLSQNLTASATRNSSRPGSSQSNHSSSKKQPEEEAWESLGVDSLSITDSAEESAFKEANNASETPAVQQFMCIPQPSKGTEWPPIAPAAPFVDAATMNGSSSAVNSSEREFAKVPETVELPKNADVCPPPTFSAANLHSRYLTNSKGQTLIISACSPLIVGMAENILLRQIPTLQSVPTQLEMVTSQKKATKDGSVQCDLLHDKSFGSIGGDTNADQVSASNSVTSTHPATGYQGSAHSTHPATGYQGSAHSTHPTVSATVDLFVRHLHESVDDRILFAAFEPFEGLLNARVHTDDDGYSKGFGFVSFATLEAANVAIDTMNGAELRTKRLFVDLAKRKDELKPSDREHDDHQNKPVYSHFSKPECVSKPDYPKPTYLRSKSETSTASGGRSANRQIDDPLFDDTDICGVEEFGAVESGTPFYAGRPAREAPSRDNGVKWHVTGKSRGVAPPTPRDPQDPASMRVSLDPRGRYIDDEEDEAREEDPFGPSSPQDSPREPVVVGPWLKMAVQFAGKDGENEEADDLVGDPQPMEKLLDDIPSTGETDRFRQFLLALSLSPLSQEPPMENWELYCRQHNDCCVECMTEAFHPLRYLDYWERTSPQERSNRRPAYEEHDNRKLDYPKEYEEHDHRKVDYAKLYGQSRSSVQSQRSNPSSESLSPNQLHSPAEEPSDLLSVTRNGMSTENSDLTMVTTLESADDQAKSHRASQPPGFDSQSTIICEDQLSALMLSTDFEDDNIDTKIRGVAPRNKMLSSTADNSLLINASTLAEEMKKFDDSP